MTDKYETRTVKKVMWPAGVDLFDERATTVEIEDEGGGEFVVVRQHDPGHGGLAIDASEWPTLRALIDEMVAECKERSERKETGDETGL